MSAIDFNRGEQAFRAAMAARGAGAAPGLAALCGGDEGLAQEVRSLLEHLDLAGQEERDAARAQTDRLSAAFLNPAELHDDRLAAVGSVSGAAQRGGGGAAAPRNGAAGVAAPMLEEW